jgi:hypothetical protein
MGTRKKSSGVGAVVQRSNGCGSTAPVDRALGAIPEQRAAIVEAEANAILRSELDGECHRHGRLMLAETQFRVLWIPSSVTDDPLAALITCRERGLLREKLNRMAPQDANYLEMTTLAVTTPEN